MLSALRLPTARPGLPRPSRVRLVIAAPVAAARSGDGGDKKRPSLRRPNPGPAPPPADKAQPSEPGSPERQKAADGRPSKSNGVPQGLSLRRPKPRTAQPSAGKGRAASPRQQQQPSAARPGTKSIPGHGELMQQIRDADSSQQVVRLVHQAGQLCNAFHFSAAVNQVAKLHRRQASAGNHAAFAALLAFAEQHPAALDRVAVVQTVYAGGVLQHQLTAQQQAAWQKRLVWAFGQPGLRPNELSNGVWGWSRMSLPLQPELAAAAEAAVLRLAEQMSSQNVANTLVAYANAGWQLNPAAASALLQRLEQVLPVAKPQEVANSLWAAAKLGLRLSSSLEAALLQRLEQALPSANPQDVSNSLWAAAKLGLWLSGSLEASFVEALLRIVPAATSQALSNILLACGTLGWSPGQRVLAAAAAAVQQRLTSEPGIKCQAPNNFLWGLAELQEQGAQLPDSLPALLEAAADWASTRWGQLAALDVTDLCFNLARLGHRPGGNWLGSATARCLECIAAGAVEGARFANLIWACSTWGHRLQRSELEQLVPAAVDSICADWPEPGRGAALQLVEALTRKEGFRVGPDHPAASAAFEGRLLPLALADIDLVTAGRLQPQIGELPYLTSWVSCLAAIGLRMPERQLESICSYVGQHAKQLRPVDRAYLKRAFEAWGYQPGLALLEQLDA